MQPPVVSMMWQTNGQRISRLSRPEPHSEGPKTRLVLARREGVNDEAPGWLPHALQCGERWRADPDPSEK